MYFTKVAALEPRNGHTLVVGIGARISGCPSQKEISLDDQIDHAKEVVQQMYTGNVEYRAIATKGKGERLDRPELAQIERELRKRELDLFIWEDLGRLVRGGDAVRILGIAVDHGTRVIVPNDCIDTAEDTWEQDALSASSEHVGHNAHTSKRLKFKLMNRFVKFGGATARPIYGYIIPSNAKTYAEWIKDEAATPIIQEGLALLRTSLNCSSVAALFNLKNIPTGPYCRRETWDGKMTRRFYQNRILGGVVGRGFRKTVKLYEDGKRVSVQNPDGPHLKEYPHLAHLDLAELDDVNSKITAANAAYKRKSVNGQDPLLRVPRKRTIFPGQHMRCWYCGRHYVWGANGITDSLMCCGSREWRCWNSVHVPGHLIGQRIVEMITSELYALEGFDAQWREMVTVARQNASGGVTQRWAALTKEEENLANQKKNVLDSIAEFGPQPWIKEKLAELDQKGRSLLVERHRLEMKTNDLLELPESVIELRQKFEEEFRRLSFESPEFGNLLRLLVPEFYVYLVRLCDGGHLLPRAKIRFELAANYPDVSAVTDAERLFSKRLTVDLFEPPQRERIRKQAVQLADEGIDQREIARRIAEQPTQTAVQKALTLERARSQAGLDEPYIFVAEPPADYLKLRRHKNANYKFLKLEGYTPTAI